MATMINNNVGSFGSQPMFGQSKAAFQRGIGQRTAMTGIAGDALGSMSILNQNRIAAQRETQRASKTTQTDDDAINNVSAYTIEESLRIRTQVLGQANKNIQDDTALLKTAQGSGNSIVDSIKEIQRLATTATDEALTDVDRRVIQRDINRLVNQISADSQITFNGRKLIDGSATTSNPSTATILSNNALYSGTTASTALTALQNSNGGSLGIEATDRITASYVQGGNIYTTSFTVGNNKLEDIFINLNKINGVSLRDSAFVGGASNILTKPVEPPAPIAPVAPIAPAAPTAPIAPTKTKEVPQPVIPREFVPDSAPALESFETADEYHAAEAIYGAVQAGTATIIEEDVENYASKSFEERTAEITAYNQYLNEMDIYNSAQANYEAAYAKYETYLENNPDAAEADSPTNADYNRYVNQKDSYDSARAAFNTAYAEFANYVANAPDHSAAYENYAAYLDTAPNSVDMERKGIVNAYNEYLRQNGNYSTAEDYQAAYEKYSAYVEAYPDLVEQYERESSEYERLYSEYETYKNDYEKNFLPQYQKDLADYNVMAADIVKPDGSNGLSVEARKPGLTEQISGVSINVADASGNTKSAATSVLNNFRTTTFAEDAREDNSVFFQIGETIDQTINFGFNDMRAEAFGLKGTDGNIISISTKEDADAALSTINNALNKATEQLQTIGSSEKRLGYIADSLAIEINNIQEPDSMIRNANMAKTLTVYALDFFQRDRMQSMFAIANQHSSAVLGLLR